jgi:DNA-binding SARP family transcriptional activator/Tfp pilus assembly protein PilF
MADDLEFCLLGPLVVRSGGVLVPMRQAKQRVLLATLLLAADRVVPVEALAEALWGSVTPPSARNTVRNYVKRLRDALGEAGRARISSQPGGYSMRVSPGELDVRRFEALLGAAREAVRNGSWAGAADQAHAALLLWRGEALADIDSELLRQREVSRLAEMRLYAQEIRADAAVRLGRQAEVIGELRQQVAAYPLRERFHALLMLALYRDGRQAEALAAYQHAYRVLADELAAEPGTELRELHHRILSGEAALGAPGSASATARELNGAPVAQSAPRPAADEVPAVPPQQAGARADAVPRQLPAAVGSFTGRDTELAALTGLLPAQPAARPPAMVIAVISGTAGVGKTALAVHWAHEVAGHFPDGQLFVNLRGYDPDRLMSAADALAGFLRALGVPGQNIPPDADERAALYRSLLSGRRMLVVLDNARSAEQVRPLLPSSPTCAVVVTSRDALAGLVARDGAIRLDLDLLPLDDAVCLMRVLIGQRVDDVPAAARALAERCSRLPLALRVAAEWAAARPGVPLAALAEELASQRRLDLLEAGGDPRTGVRAVFSWSYRHLDPVAARGFRLVSSHPGPDLDLYAAAAVAGATLEEARHAADVLVHAHMIQPAGPDRYGLHDLLRGYARELSAAEDAPDERRSALTRLFGHYLYAAATAMDSLYPGERHRRPRIPAPASAVPPLTEPAAARTWLDAERANLIAVAAYTADYGWPGHAIQLATTVFRYLEVAGHYPEAVTITAHARRAARDSGDLAAEARALSDLAVIDLRLSRIQRAETNLRQALGLYRQTGDPTGQARVLGNLGIASFQEGRYSDASDHNEQALAQYRQAGDRFGEARMLNNLGVLDLRLGRYDRAGDHLRHAGALGGETSNWAVTSQSLVNLALIDVRQGRYEQAGDRMREAQAINADTGNVTITAGGLVCLGLIDLRQERHEQASARFRQALKLSRECGDHCGEAEALHGLGEVYLATGQAGHAVARYRAALDQASAAGDKYEQARALCGLADGHHAAGEPVRAQREWRQALALFSVLGTPEAGEIRDRLARAGQAEQAPRDSAPSRP